MALLVGCSSGLPATSPPVTGPVHPAATPGASTVPPGSTGAGVVITAITYADDAASRFFAAVELGPNDAGIHQLDLYRGTDGRLSRVVAHDATNMPAVISFDPQGRPIRIDSRGYVVELTYPAADVEVAVTAPDGTVVRERGPFDLGASVRERTGPMARLASYAEVRPEPGMVPMPMSFYSYSVVDLEVVHKGANEGLTAHHVRFRDVGCSPDSGMDCDAQVGTSLATTPPTSKVLVSSHASTLDEPEADSWVWRTRAECDQYTTRVQRILSTAGWAQMAGGGIYQVVSLATKAVPWLGLTVFTVGATLKIWSAVDSSGKPECQTVKSLEQLEDAFLDRRSGKTATVTVTATGDCDRSPTSGWRIKDPTQTISFQPFRPDNRSPFGAVGSLFDVDGLPIAGTIRFQATDCAVAMRGTFDMAATAREMGAPASAAAAFAAMFTDNSIVLELKKPAAPSTAPILVTGTLTLTAASANTCGRSDGPGSVATQWITGTLEGRITQADGYRASGDATISYRSSANTCLAVPSLQATRFAWQASGDESTLRGTIDYAEPGHSMRLIFIVHGVP